MIEQPSALVCLSHLPWNHVWQRPQQLMSRFAQRCPVIYADPPDFAQGGGPAYLEECGTDAGVQVVRPRFPVQTLDTPDNSYRELWLSLLPQLLADAGPNPIVWVFSPLADYLMQAAKSKASLAVYDCMDDLASFRGATQDMRDREARLLGLADIVFTGGYSMYVARKDRHPRVHCFPSGVDIAHYEQVREAATTVPESIADLPHPRLSYFGVLDERIDWELIAEVAERKPDWHWVLVGPTAKIDPAALPTGSNIHYLGQQQYADLPRFLKGFDIATMPFALNEATKYISPTKTLEYLAGGKPVISSSVPDVVAFYQDIVYLADGVDAWIATVEQMLQATNAEQQARRDRAAPLLDQSSWDSIAERMWNLMMEQMAANYSNGAVGAVTDTASVSE